MTRSASTTAFTLRAAISIWIAALALSFASFTATSQPPLRLAVIAHTGIRESELDIDELRAVFFRRRLVWSNGMPIIVFHQPSGSVARLAFDKTLMGFDAEQAAHYWIDARIRNGTQPPRTVSSDAVLVRIIASLAGSIAYVPAEQVTAGLHVVARVEAGRVLPP